MKRERKRETSRVRKYTRITLKTDKNSKIKDYKIKLNKIRG